MFRLLAEIPTDAFTNKALIYNLLLKTAPETTLIITVCPKHLAAQIDIIALLHIGGSAMTRHTILPGGGVAPGENGLISPFRLSSPSCSPRKSRPTKPPDRVRHVRAHHTRSCLVTRHGPTPPDLTAYALPEIK